MHCVSLGSGPQCAARQRRHSGHAEENRRGRRRPVGARRWRCGGGAQVRASRRLSAAYYLPLLAHATMEPMNCTADVKADGCDLYVGTQVQQVAQTTAATAAGLSPAQVRVYTTLIGGGFGRRLDIDFIPAAVEASKAVGSAGQSDLDARRRHDPRHLPAARLRRGQRRPRRGGKTHRVEIAHHQPLDHRAHVSARQRRRSTR